MSNNKAFTLMEIIVVVIIIGVLSIIAIPNYYTSMEQGMATAAQNNLVNIYNAQKIYYYSNGNYCVSYGSTTDCGYNISNLNTKLASINQSSRTLNITDSNFNYSCTDPNSGTDGNTGTSFSCTATNTKDSNFILTLTNNPIVLPGGSGTRNPKCSDTDSPSYCPS